MKTKFLLISLSFLLCLHIPMLSQTPFVSHNILPLSSVVSAELWSDDFNDGNIDDWSVWGWNSTDAEKDEGNFTLTDGSLRAQGENTSIASHVCQMTTGTWSFDVDCVPTDNNHFYIAFFTGEPTNDTLDPPYEYGIMVVTGVFASLDTEFVLYRRSAGSLTIASLIGRYNLSTVTGWHHIDITRDTNGRFYVYFNGTLEISGVDTTFNNAEYFSFYTNGGPAIDNIVVSDTIDIDQVGPFLSNPGNQEIQEGESFLLDLEASDYSGISTWWVNDTEHFMIDSGGDIDNATILTSGRYGIRVSVNDTSNYVSSVEFTLIVSTASSTSTTNTTSSGGETDTMMLILIAGSAVVVIIVLVVVIKVKR